MRLPRFRSAPAALIVALALSSTSGSSAGAEGEADFLAGRSKACLNCSLPNAALKRKDLTAVDLSGANLAGAVMHRAQALQQPLDRR